MAAVEPVVVFDLRQQFDDAASARRGGKEFTRGASTELNARSFEPCGSLPAVAKYARREFANILGIVPVHGNNVTPTGNRSPQVRRRGDSNDRQRRLAGDRRSQ